VLFLVMLFRVRIGIKQAAVIRIFQINVDYLPWKHSVREQVAAV